MNHIHFSPHVNFIFSFFASSFTSRSFFCQVFFQHLPKIFFPQKWKSIYFCKYKLLINKSLILSGIFQFVNQSIIHPDSLLDCLLFMNYKWYRWGVCPDFLSGLDLIKDLKHLSCQVYYRFLFTCWSSSTTCSIMLKMDSCF